MWATIGVAILGGLTTSTFFTLIILSTFYSIFDSITTRVRNSLDLIMRLQGRLLLLTRVPVNYSIFRFKITDKKEIIGVSYSNSLETIPLFPLMRYFWFLLLGAIGGI